VGRRAQRRRSTTAADDDLTQHVLEKQVEPQLAAQRARALGIPVDIGFVNTAEDATGWTVTCEGCGRTAKLAFDPGTKVGLCPACVAASGV
jgi:hypothetical protein